MEDQKELKRALELKELELKNALSEIDRLKASIQALSSLTENLSSKNTISVNQELVVPTFECDYNGNLLSINEAGKRILGYFTHSSEKVSARFFTRHISTIGYTIGERFEVEMKLNGHLFLFSGVADSDKFEVEIQTNNWVKEVDQFTNRNPTQNQQIIKNDSDILFRCNIHGFFTYVNLIAIKVLGYSESEFLNMHFSQLIRADYKERTKVFYSNQLLEKNPNTYLEFPVICKNGEEIYISQFVQLIIQDHEVIEISAIARDITEKKRTQDALAKLSSRFTAIICNANAGIIVAGETGIVENINKQFIQIFFPKKRPEDLIGIHIDRLLFQISLKTSNPKLFRARTKEDIQFEKSIHQQMIELSDGRFLRYDFFPLIESNVNLGYFWFFRDVTEEQEIQKVIRRSEEKYRGILENLDLGIMEVDNQEIIISVNQRFCDMLGYAKPEEMIGKRTIDLLLPEENALEVLKIKEERKSGRSGVYEFNIRNVHGNRIPFLISGAPIYDENGQIIGSIGLHMDMTQQKQIERELEEAKLKAEASAKSKEIFLAHMSHEIRTPMNAIIGMAGLLAQSNLSAKQKVYLDAIQISSNNLLNIINDILDFSKIEAGKLSIETVGFKPESLITNTVSAVSQLAAGKSILIDVQIDKNLPEILLGDPLRINQILINLFSNAVKFTHEGRITLSASYSEKHCLILSVTDTGIGIEEEKLQAIFESFTQADNSISRKFGGTGLGLTITRQLTELMGGTISVESKVGHGSTFKVTIPLDLGNQNDLPISSQISPANLEKLIGLKILLVEDNSLNQFLATTILESKGLHIEIAENGFEAIEKLKLRKYDLVLMDIQMPHMGGLEATHIIRNELNIRTPIIALTAKAIKGDEQLYLDAGMDGYLSKPFEPEQLVKAVSRILNIPEISELETYIKETSLAANYNLEKIRSVAAGNIEFERKMVTLFVTNTPLLLEELSIGLYEKNYDSVYNVAHQLIPSIDLFQIDSISQIIRNIEDSARNRKDLETIELLSKKINSELNHCIMHMKKEFDL